MQIIAYNAAATGLKMWAVEVNPDRNIRGSNRLKDARRFTPEVALKLLPYVRQIHRDAWIERADGSRINPSEGHSDAL